MRMFFAALLLVMVLIAATAYSEDIVTVLIGCTVWCDWFSVCKRTDSWPDGRQCSVWSIFVYGLVKIH